MRFVNVVVLVYALLTIAIGAQAYLFPSEGAKASPISLIAGAVAGLLLLGSLALAKTNPRAGRISSAVVTLLLLGRFIGPLLEKQQVYPAGVMVTLSAITLAVLVGGHILKTRQAKSEPA